MLASLRGSLLLALGLCVALTAACGRKSSRGEGDDDDDAVGGDGDADADVDGDSDGDADSDADVDGDTDGDGDVDGDADVDPGDCASECMSEPNAVCCGECGCGGGQVPCRPVCPTNYTWDCELLCCFDYENFVCAP